jgi:hypothetical protein
MCPLCMPADTTRQVRHCGPSGHLKPLWLRILAAAVVMAVAGTGAINYTKAGRVLQVQLGYLNNIFSQEPAELCEAPAGFVHRKYHHFTPMGELTDAPRSGQPPLIPMQRPLPLQKHLLRGKLFKKPWVGRW